MRLPGSKRATGSSECVDDWQRAALRSVGATVAMLGEGGSCVCSVSLCYGSSYLPLFAFAIFFFSLAASGVEEKGDILG